MAAGSSCQEVTIRHLVEAGMWVDILLVAGGQVVYHHNLVSGCYTGICDV